MGESDLFPLKFPLLIAFKYQLLCIVFSHQYLCIFRFMMVGDPFSGKTTVLEVLAETLNLLTDRGYDDESVNKVLNSNKLDGTN